MLGLFALQLLLAAAVPEAAPPDASRILVVAAGDDVDTEALYAGLGAAGLLPVQLDERAGVDRDAPPPPAAADRDDARAHLQEAKARFRELDLDAARAAVDVAVDEILRLERPEDAAEILVDALLLKASLALQSDDDEDARASLTLVARIDPDKSELNPGLYPPSLCEAYAAARRAAVDDAATGSVVIKPRVAGFGAADVLIDLRGGAGGAAGEIELPAGPHVITARAAGDVPFTRVVVVRANEATVLAPFLAPRDAVERRRALVIAARAAQSDDGKKAALSDLAELCAARAVLYVGAAAVHLWSPRGLDTLPLPARSTPQALGAATLAALQAPVKRGGGDVVVPPPGSGAEFPTLAVVVGSGVALVAVASLTALALYALLPGNPPEKPPAPPLDAGCCIF